MFADNTLSDDLHEAEMWFVSLGTKRKYPNYTSVWSYPYIVYALPIDVTGSSIDTVFTLKNGKRLEKPTLSKEMRVISDRLQKFLMKPSRSPSFSVVDVQTAKERSSGVYPLYDTLIQYGLSFDQMVSGYLAVALEANWGNQKKAAESIDVKTTTLRDILNRQFPDLKKLIQYSTEKRQRVYSERWYSAADIMPENKIGAVVPLRQMYSKHSLSFRLFKELCYEYALILSDGNFTTTSKLLKINAGDPRKVVRHAVIHLYPSLQRIANMKRYHR